MHSGAFVQGFQGMARQGRWRGQWSLVILSAALAMFSARSGDIEEV